MCATRLPAQLLPAHLDARFELIRDSKYVSTRPFILAVEPDLDYHSLYGALREANELAGHNPNAVPRTLNLPDADHMADVMSRYLALTDAAERIGRAGDRAFAGQPDFIHPWTNCTATCAASLFDVQDAVLSGEFAQMLNLNDSPFSGELSLLRACPNLLSLAIAGAGYQLDGPLDLEFEQFPKLKFLAVVGSGVTQLPHGLFECNDLRYLGVSKNELTNLPGVENLGQLLYLNVRGNPLAHGELERVREALPNCKIVA